MGSDGLKQLTSKNWLEADPASLVRSAISFPGRSIPTPPWPERLDEVLRPRLTGSVPTDVAALFETGQGAMAYGYFYYRLYTLGAEHLLRAFEAAVVLRARREGFDAERAMLADTLRWLTTKGVLTQADCDALQPLRTLRNAASHPGFQSLLTPGMAIAFLDDIAKEIGVLLPEVAS
jgi:hypothetical protein